MFDRMKALFIHRRFPRFFAAHTTTAFFWQDHEKLMASSRRQRFYNIVGLPVLSNGHNFSKIRAAILHFHPVHCPLSNSYSGQTGHVHFEP
jgi:hypothetical protein